MKIIFCLCGIFFSNIIFASENSLFLENKQALLNFGLGIVEALDDPVLVENGTPHSSFHEPNRKLKTSIEKYKNFTIKKIEKSTNEVFVYSLLAIDKELTLPFGGPIGTLQTDDLEMALGVPDARSESYFEYYVLGQIGTNKIIFNFSSSGIESILWEWDVD